MWLEFVYVSFEIFSELLHVDGNLEKIRPETFEMLIVLDLMQA